MKKSVALILPLMLGCGNQSNEVDRSVTWRDGVTETKYSDWSNSPSKEYIDCHRRDKEDGIFDILVVYNKRTHLIGEELVCSSSVYNQGDSVIHKNTPEWNELQAQFRRVKLLYKPIARN